MPCRRYSILDAVARRTIVVFQSVSASRAVQPGRDVLKRRQRVLVFNVHLAQMLSQDALHFADRFGMTMNGNVSGRDDDFRLDVGNPRASQADDAVAFLAADAAEQIFIVDKAHNVVILDPWS